MTSRLGEDAVVQLVRNGRTEVAVYLRARGKTPKLSIVRSGVYRAYVRTGFRWSSKQRAFARPSRFLRAEKRLRFDGRGPLLAGKHLVIALSSRGSARNRLLSVDARHFPRIPR